MEKSQLDKLRSRLSEDEGLRTISTYYRDHKGTYTTLSARGVFNGLKAHGTPIGLPKAREFLSVLADCGVGKGVKGGDGKISNVVKMVINTREIGEAVMGVSKNLRRFNADRKERNIEGAAEAVRASPKEFKVYPARQAGHISVSININGRMVSLIIPDDTPPELIPVIYERLKKTDDSVYGK